MPDHNEFQEQVRKLGELVTRFDEMPDSPQKSAARELVQFLMEVHGEGLERILEIIFEDSASGSALIDRLGRDEIAGGLLLLYSLHPDAIETRVQKAVEQVRSRLRKVSYTIELLSLEDAAVRVQLVGSGHSCGSTANEVRSIVENSIYELAPDLKSLEIMGLEEPAAGFVTLESLVTGPAHNGNATHAASVR